MKLKAKLCATMLSMFLVVAVVLITHSALSQQPIIERANPHDLVPEEGQKGPTDTPTPNTHDVIGDGNDDLAPEPGASKTIYDRNEDEKPPANAFEIEHRGRINYGKRAEQMVQSKPSKPNKIVKTKDGSSDTTEGTGLFKDGLLDSVDGELPLPRNLSSSATPGASPRIGPSGSPKVHPSASPKLKQRLEPVTAPQLDITLGTTEPEPMASASPASSPEQR